MDVEIIGGEKLTGTVSDDFTDLPPEQALKRILTGVNYVLKERPALIVTGLEPLSHDHLF